MARNPRGPIETIFGQFPEPPENRPRRTRDYSREYQRRNELAKERGFKSYGAQRRYTEYTGTPTRYVIAPPEPIYIPSPRYDFGDYYTSEDRNLDAFIRMAR